jgi:DNA-binding FrmR family transcriptional regulator
MHNHEHSDESIVRLSKIEGHIRGIKNMIETGRECEDVLIQISAVQAALKNLSILILEDHLNHCIVDAINIGKGSEVVESFGHAIKHVLK